MLVYSSKDVNFVHETDVKLPNATLDVSPTAIIKYLEFIKFIQDENNKCEMDKFARKKDNKIKEKINEFFDIDIFVITELQNMDNELLTQVCTRYIAKFLTNNKLKDVKNLRFKYY